MDIPSPENVLAGEGAFRLPGNGPQVVKQSAAAALSVPPGFTVRLFASGFSNPRLMRVAPNCDIFIAETGENRIHILRAVDGAVEPAENQIFTQGLDRPFGIAFYLHAKTREVNRDFTKI